MSSNKAKLIAFYLPQYHPIPENNAWWGEGFTEWTNVKKAKPSFPGHYQPHIPGELGYYDLRDPAAREAQAVLAQQYGIYGFCYYHYWLHGKRLLETPFNEVLKSGKPDFPFCLCWANENWTRIWDGSEKSILMEQTYSEADHKSHIQWLSQAFKDKRYIRIEGKPLFLVYRTSKIPDIRNVADMWRNEAIKAGVGEIYLCRVESGGEIVVPEDIGFDAAVAFPPHRPFLHSIDRFTRWKFKLYSSFGLVKNNPIFRSYPAGVRSFMQRKAPAYERFPCVMPSFDNSSRRHINRIIYLHSSPKMYQRKINNK